MTSKSKKDKIKQGDQRDFDLLYDVLVSGGTYSDYRSELLDRSMPQEQQNFDISEDDILAAWILGKDEESELYARGGHIHQDQPWMLNPNNKGIGLLQKDLNQNSFTSSASESDYTPTGLYSSDSGHNYTAGIPYVQQFDSLGGLGFNVAANANGASDDPYAKFIMGDTSGGFLQQMMSQKSSLREGANYIKGLELNFGIGDNAYLAQQYNQMQPIARSTMDADAVDTWKWIFDPSGIMHSWGLIDYDASEGLDYLNSIAEQVENRNKLNFNTAVINSNKLNLWNQLSQPYMAANGGKMKNRLAGGGYINSHYDYITDPLVKVDAGGTHQENPNEGVLTSIAPDGKPNLVEEGETIINNGQEDAYVFSDRIVADEEILKSHLLPDKFAGKTYADISKELDKIIEEHKNDEISKRTFDEMISRLQQAQEDQKYQEKAEEVAKFIDGLSDEEKEQLEQTMVEEAQAEQQAVEEQAIAEQQAQEQAAQEQQMQPEQAPEQVVMEQPEEQVVPSRYDQMMSRALFADAANQGMFGRGGHLHQTKGNLITATKPVYGPEGNIIGYETPQPKKWTPKNEPAQLNADNRGWYDRTYDKADTWLKNHVALYGDTGINPFLFMPYVGNVVGTLEGIRDNNPLEVALSAGFGPWGKIGKTRKAVNTTSLIQKNTSRVFDSEKALLQEREIDKLHRASDEFNAGRKASKATKPILEVRKDLIFPQAKTSWFSELPTGKKAAVTALGTTAGAALVGTGAGIAKVITEVNEDRLFDEYNNKKRIENNKSYLENKRRNEYNNKYRAIMYSNMTTEEKNNAYKRLDEEYGYDNEYALGGHLNQYGNDVFFGYGPSWLDLLDNSSHNSSASTSSRTYSQPTKKQTKKAKTNTNQQEQTSLEESTVGFIPDNLTYPYSLDLFGSPVYEQDFHLKYNPNLAKYNIGDYKLTSPVVRDSKGNMFVIDNNGLRKADKLGFDYTTSSSKQGNISTNNADVESTGHSTWLRYAPAIGSGIQYLSDLFGITNRNDYTNANLFQRSINNIPSVNYLPIGNSYINYSPLDEAYQQNVLRSAARANARGVINNASGNAGAAIAALNNLNYGTTNSLGDLSIKVADYNNQMAQKVAEHNFRVNAINASHSLSAQEKNQAIAAEKARLNYNLAQMRQNIEDNNDIAKAANFTNLMTNLGNIGRENFIMNQINSNMGLYYGVDRDGNAYYKSAYNDLSEDAKELVDEYIKSRGLTVK